MFLLIIKAPQSTRDFSKIQDEMFFFFFLLCHVYNNSLLFLFSQTHFMIIQRTRLVLNATLFHPENNTAANEGCPTAVMAPNKSYGSFAVRDLLSICSARVHIFTPQMNPAHVSLSGGNI